MPRRRHSLVRRMEVDMNSMSHVRYDDFLENQIDELEKALHETERLYRHQKRRAEIWRQRYEQLAEVVGDVKVS